MSMFCYQCQETARNTGCTVKGVCGKNTEVSNLQDLLIYVTKGISQIVRKNKLEIASFGKVNHELLSSLFMTITNANFDNVAIEAQIVKMMALRDELASGISMDGMHDAAIFTAKGHDAIVKKSESAEVGVLVTQNEDVRSLRELVTYGLKGIAAYAEHR